MVSRLHRPREQVLGWPASDARFQEQDIDYKLAGGIDAEAMERASTPSFNPFLDFHIERRCVVERFP